MSERDKQRLEGKLAYLKMINPEQAKRLRPASASLSH
jgi:hypothetical protein